MMAHQFGGPSGLEDYLEKISLVTVDLLKPVQVPSQTVPACIVHLPGESNDFLTS